FLASVAAVATLPNIAQAACSGSACSALMLTTTWSPSDRQVKAVLTNKDQSREVKLKLCITVASICKDFEVTLAPRAVVMKNVPIPGAPGSAPPNFSGEVMTANFAAGQTASGPAAPAGGGATNGLETPFGKITYFTSQNVDLNSLSRGVANFSKGKELYLKVGPRYLALIDATRKVGSIQEIEAEIRKTMAANPGAQRKADMAKQIERNADTLGEVLRLVAELARNAGDNLTI